MERKAFLKTLGAGAAFALAFPCLNGCSSDSVDGEVVPIPTGIDFIIDLSSSEASKLAENGGFILKNFVVIVRNLEGDFVAASQICSHEGYDQVRFVKNEGGFFHCNVHGSGSRFSQDGTPLNQVDAKPAKPLKIYNTELLANNMLRIFE